MKNLILLVLIVSCSKVEIEDISKDKFHNSSSQLKNIELFPVQVFGDTPSYYFSNIDEFTVDNEDNVYIEENAINKNAIYKYNSDGKLIGKFGTKGKGPGEYLSICCLKVNNNKLYMLDPGLDRLNVYDVNNFKIINVYNLNPVDLKLHKKYHDDHIFNFILINDSTIVAAYTEPAIKNVEIRTRTYFEIILNSEKQPVKMFEEHSTKWIYFDYKGYKLYTMFPFYSKPLLTFSNDGYFYSANSQDFIIQKLDVKGNLISSIQHDVTPVLTSDTDISNVEQNSTKQLLRTIDIPKYWPVLNSLNTDDKNRLWISTFTKYNNIIDWWVFDINGNLEYTFSFQGNEGIKYSWPHNSANYYVINNDYFYYLKKSADSSYVVKYKINYKE